MTLSPDFTTVAPADLRRLIEGFPLAWVCSEGMQAASMLPLVGEFDEQDRLVALIGHFGRRNPLHAALMADGGATVLFCGPQGYVSPNHAGRRDWGATWNYAQARMTVQVDVDDRHTAMALDLLASHAEAGLAEPWHPAELGPRYDQLAAHIIGFRATVVDVAPRFKLGQDESVADLQAILGNLADGDLRDWMIHANRHRL